MRSSEQGPAIQRQPPGDKTVRAPTVLATYHYSLVQKKQPKKENRKIDSKEKSANLHIENERWERGQESNTKSTQRAPIITILQLNYE